MKPSTLILLSAFLTFCSCESPDLENDITTEIPDFVDPDANLTVPELIKKYGYPFEEYTVTTTDGYILTLHRIPHGKKSKKVSKKVVFLMHGLMGSSAEWVIAGPEFALGYILADTGYDVWMGNARGNKYSRKHKKYNTNETKYWNFNWHEIGIYDMPAMIDNALKITGQKKIFSVGYSQGTTVFYVMASMRPEYNKKIKVHISLAPIAFMNHAKSRALRWMAGLLDTFKGSFVNFWVSNFGSTGEFLPTSNWFVKQAENFCNRGEYTRKVCDNVLFLITGGNAQHLNKTLLPVVLNHLPAGASHWEIFHHLQNVNSGHFRQFDHSIENLFYYDQWSPPDYNLSAITAPIVLLYSRNDGLSNDTDVDRLCSALGDSCKSMSYIADGSYTHMDYLYAVNATQDVFKRVIWKLHKFRDT